MASKPMTFDIHRDRLITAKLVSDKLKISRAMLGRLLRSDRFPKCLLLVNSSPRWSEHEVDEWIRARPKREPLTRRRGHR